MSLTRAEVEKVSHLARLQFSDAELDQLTTELSAILGYVEQLGTLNTEEIAPMAHGLDVHNVFRADALQPSLPRDEALANAPKSDGECYLVPAVLGE
jgi:aspartyl-tRNA(Asn)/glutamyl-tRNA(Gln) amidotransferase subunit C